MSDIKADGALFSTDKDGYLEDINDWNETVAQLIASRDELELTKFHWSIVHFIREFYIRYHKHPPVRVMVKHLKLTFGVQSGNSAFLHELFPKGPVKQSAKIAGLPKPLKCL